MIPQGSFQYALCEKRYNQSKKREAYRSYFPERKIPICEYRYDEFWNSPEHADLRPDVDPSEKEKVEKIREYYGDTHIYF